MKTLRTPALLALSILAAAAASALSCSSGRGGAASPGVSPSAPPAESAQTGTPDKTASQLWAENCGRCHNIRSPGSYTPREWDVVLRHMRLRANLTEKDERAIAEFLESGSSSSK